MTLWKRNRSSRFLAVVSIVSLLASISQPIGVYGATSDNLISNPSVEVGTGAYPDSWSREKSGNNVSVFYNKVAGQDGQRAVQINVTSYSTGYSGWFFSPISADSGASYQYSEYYTATMKTNLFVRVTNTSGQTTTTAIQSNIPTASNWTQLLVDFAVPADAKSFTVIHRTNSIGTLTTDNFSLTKKGGSAPPIDTVLPTVSVTAPTAGSTVSGTQTLSANASDNVGVAGVQFLVDGTAVGSEDLTSPYSVSLDTKTLTNAAHTVTARARDAAGNTATSAGISFTVNNTDTVLPTVSVTAPTAGSTVSGTQTLSANASDNVGVAGVQFLVDGTAVGSEDLTSPYSVSLDTKTLTNAAHTVTARARDAAGNTATSAGISFTVNNSAASGTNIIPNPSLETVSPTNNALPLSWSKVKSGTNNASFTYLNTGHTGTRSLQTKITSFTSGVAYYQFDNQLVAAGKTYEYSVKYKADTYTEADAEITLADGTVQYQYLGVVYPSPSGWSTFTTRLTLPINAKSVTAYVLLYSAGTLVTDDYSLTPVTIVPLQQPIVTLTFDDFFTSFYDNAFPLFKKYGMTGTMYLVTSDLDQPGLMTSSQLHEIQSYGFEIGSHTVTHPHLPLLTPADLDAELLNSKNTLSKYMGTSIDSFASPYGEYTDEVLTHIAKYYSSHRSVDVGYNTKDNFTPYNIKAMSPTVATTPEEVLAWVDEAIRNKALVSIVYHDIVNNGTTWSNTPAHLETVLAGLKARGVRVETTRQAVAEVQQQMP